jgi:hypothetical protein
MGGFRSFVATAANGEVAPIPDLPALTPEGGGSPLSGHSVRRMKLRFAQALTFQNVPILSDFEHLRRIP